MNQIDYENLGTRMKELRIKMKLTQAEVARALNVTPGYISNVENNRTAMSLRILIYYARLLNISLDSLIGRIDSEYRETALDREISEQVHKLEIPQKQKLLKTMKVWMDEDLNFCCNLLSLKCLPHKQALIFLCEKSRNVIIYLIS